MASEIMLKEVEVFSSMEADQLRSLQPYCQEVTYKKGNKLFTEGDRARELWFVMDGRVDLRFELPDHTNSEETTMSIVDVQDNKAKTLGWSCFVPPYKMRLSAFCVSGTCRIIKIAKEELLKVFEEDPAGGYQFLIYLIKVVGFRFHQFQDEVARHRGEYMMYGW